tara:strand:- start:976 stop:1203 length:228 start_codon:yes stop_codon:yes gene_type:complete
MEKMVDEILKQSEKYQNEGNFRLAAGFYKIAGLKLKKSEDPNNKQLGEGYLRLAKQMQEDADSELERFLREVSGE